MSQGPMTIAVIPARMNSTRLPGKPLLEVGGKPIIQHVWEKSNSPLIDFKIVATDSSEIQKVVEEFGGRAIMTSPHHHNGSERCAEVIQSYPDYELIINIQGDEPMVNRDVIQKLLEPFSKYPKVEVTTLKTTIDHTSAKNPNVVKVITDTNNFALYFSRSVIPYNRNNSQLQYYKHLGFYAFRRKSLLDYVEMPPSPLENIEKLEQLRLIEARKSIYVSDYSGELIDVNTEEDLEEFRKRLGKV